MTYSGPERRIHSVFVTKNTEYHTRKKVCVGVRDRTSGEWNNAHKALCKKLYGSILFTQDGILPTEGMPNPGESLYFWSGDGEVVTSSLVAVERPPKEVIAAYMS